MKLLIITQVIDTEHPILGFFHRWVEEFATHCEHVHVICLQAGSYNLPTNVTVHSLGKEVGKSKLQYLLTFYRLIWSLRHEYDNVFVHMNQQYVLLGAFIWRVLRKKIGLWYAHGAVSVSLRFAVPLADYVFTSTKEGLQINTNKKVIVGQGIDTRLFTNINTDREQSGVLRLITVGRIASSKNIETLLQACAELTKQKIDFHFTIVGVGTTDSEKQYEQEMKDLSERLSVTSAVSWVGAVPQSQLPEYLQAAGVFIHDGSTNSLDKALLEAVLCGCVVVSSNPAYRSIAMQTKPELLFAHKNSTQLVDILLACVMRRDALDTSDAQLRGFVERNFSIENLVSNIVLKY